MLLHVFMCLDRPAILYQPTNKTFTQNMTATIPCGINVVGAETVVEYYWLLNNNLLNLSSLQYSFEEGNITISSIQGEDEGVYECLANLSMSDSLADEFRFSVGSATISVICKLCNAHMLVM